LENSKLLDEKYSNRVTGSLFNIIFQLPEPSQQFLRENYLFKLDKQRINEIHHVLQNYITVRILSCPEDVVLVLNDDSGITSATKLMSWIYELNKTQKYLTLADFYNELINERINFKVDYMNWTKPPRAGSSSKFTFCHYPFILNPEIKSKILSIEAIISQRRKEQESLQMMLVQGMVELPNLYFILKVRRDHLIEDSVDTISVIKMTSPGDLKKQLRVQFVGEQGIDEGGVQKEWFQLVVEDLFSMKYGMFIQDNETHTQWFNRKSEDLTEFELLGTVVGLAIYNGVILDLHFPLFVYKKLRGIKPTLEDIDEIYPGLCQGLKQILKETDKNIEMMYLNFQVLLKYLDHVEIQDLKPGGENVSVNIGNRQEYADLYVSHLLEESVALQFDAFKKGFLSVCDGNALRLFEPDELQLLVCGSPVLDFFELEKATSYDNGYDKDSPTIKLFWDVVHNELSDAEKKKLLFFATGSDRSPIGGLGKLNFVITRHGGDTDRLPTSHTCFNHLLLPEYGSKIKLLRLLKKAITNSTGFGML